MKFVCDRCQTKYSIADEKVRGKILKVRCKACTNIITVREEPAAGAVARRAPSGAAPTVVEPSARPRALSGAAPTVVEPMSKVMAAMAPAPKSPAPPPPPRQPPPRTEEPPQWYMALDGNRTGPFTRKNLLDKISPLSADADLHIWTEQLGSWKPPREVPDISAELALRRRPPGPPPFPGAPRRPTPAVPEHPLAAGPPPRMTGTHAVAAAIGPGVGLKLPPPGSSPGARRVTGPVSRSAVMAAAGLATAPADGIDVDPSTLLETPAPQPHMLHGLGGSNGFGGAHASGAAELTSNGAAAVVDRSSERSEKSDVLDTLNLASARGPAAAPRLMSSSAIVGWEPGAAQASGGRARGGKLVLAFLAVIGLIVVVLFLNVTKKAKPVAAPTPQTTVAADPLAGIAEKTPESPPAAVAPAPSIEPGAAPTAGPQPAGHGKGKIVRGPHGHGAAMGAVGGRPVGPPPAGAAAAPANDANARYRDTSRPGLAITGGGGSSRPAPSQSEISRVIGNNRGGIKNCYQRALLRDSSLTHGKITVSVTIGISGRVKRTSVDGPPQFRSLDPCIKEMVGRWVFPQAGDEYGTEFVYVFQGNE
ncbi:MAG TPA: AgmX/PglI C-terminal domain-containing protein [Polyangia bacterium]|nr:AgmX/PglI C-terminal domain-containing protein [Polyangia bacterium]